MLEWVKKYRVTISFVIGLLTGLVSSYYKFQSRLDTIEFKIDIIREEAQKEYKNIYEIFHIYNRKLKGFGD